MDRIPPLSLGVMISPGLRATTRSTSEYQNGTLGNLWYITLRRCGPLTCCFSRIYLSFGETVAFQHFEELPVPERSGWGRVSHLPWRSVHEAVGRVRLH